MNEPSSASIKQILTAFEHVIAIYENHQWVKTVTSEDIKVAFKLGCFIEKTMCKFNEQNCQNQFLKTIKVWAESNNKSLSYEKEFYSKVCDHLLLKFFKSQSLTENVIDIAIRMYTSLFPKERLQCVLKNLIMTSASWDAIVDFTAANKATISTESLKCELILSNWCKELECGNKEKIVSSISESLNSYQVENSLPTLTGILALNVDNAVTKIILNSILEKMLDRSILSKQFWLTLLKTVDKSCLREVCINSEEFKVSFCNFLIYLGSMMEKEVLNEEIRWVSNPDMSLCPEITYSELEAIVIFLYHSSIREYILNRLSEALDLTESCIWEQIKQKCL